MEKKQKKYTVFIVFLCILAAVSAILLISRYWIGVTEYHISSERLPAEFDGFRIIQVSDLHGYEFGNENARLLNKIEAVQPDLIAITGDMADSDTDLQVIDDFLRQAVEIAPVYYVSGNHEWSCGCLEELKEIFEKYSVNYLQNSYVTLKRGEASIVLAGVEDPNGPYDMKTPDELVDIINQTHADNFKILLGHRNYWIENYPNLEVDIILCGHAHGGIVRLPVLGGVLGSGFEFFPDHIDGVFASGCYQLVVSRGLGNSIPIPRFLNPPELVVLTLKKDL